ncbi:MAG: HD-GYP domain-containing protein [Rhodospirillales bacterium]|nr:HD-GYP domain-containing protein [Rhodospirillales bacterium]
MNWARDRRLLESLMIMGAVVEARDPFTGGHLWRTSEIAKLLAQRAGLGEETVFAATVGGWLHDLGKVGIPDAVLLKRGRLDEEEYAVARRHPEIGRAILAPHPLAGLVVDTVAHHHERWDGDGYPDRLAGEAIPLVARLVAIADAFDAMTSVRPYRQPLDVPTALGRMKAEGGRQFDPGLLDAFAEIAEAGLLDHIVGHSGFERPLVLCPHCGPVIALPRSAKAGDLHHCQSCVGEYRLEAEGLTFVATATGRPARGGATPNLAEVDEMLKALEGFLRRP